MEEQKLRYLMSLNVVAYLRSHGIEPVNPEPDVTPDGKIKYWFDNSDEVKGLLTKYNNDEFVQRFIGKLRLTKSEIQLTKKKYISK